MEVCVSDFRTRLKAYLDLLCTGEDKVVKVTRQRGEDVFVIPQSYLASMTTKEFKELQRQARLKSYYDKLTDSEES